MRGINIGARDTIVGKVTASYSSTSWKLMPNDLGQPRSTPSPQAMLRFDHATQQVQGIYVFSTLLRGKGGAWEGTELIF